MHFLIPTLRYHFVSSLRVIYFVEYKKVARLVGANGLGDLVGIVAVALLELLDEIDVLALSGLGGKLVLLGDLLPGVVLGLALS
jgi:hypothetical protein